MAIGEDKTDTVVRNMMFAFLDRPEMIERLRRRQAADNAEISTVRAELAAARARHDELADAVKLKQLSIAFAARSEPAMLKEIKDLEARDQELSTPSVLRGLIVPGVSLASKWESFPISAARALARTLFTPELMGHIAHHPRTRPCLSVPAIDRIRFDAADVADGTSAER